jgi:SAM-dependent methyltransferase
VKSVEDRARESGGISLAPVYQMLAQAMDERGIAADVLVDVGCGRGDFSGIARRRTRRYVGVDVLRHAGFPEELELVLVDLETGRVPLDDGFADVVTCAETIEHVENPRALARELTRLLKPGGWLFVTTPNQLSLASLLCLLGRGQFQSFQEAPGSYPAHLSALLEIDLVRIARECGLTDIDVLFSGSGRVPFTARHWPKPLQVHRGRRARAFSDNILMCARKATSATSVASSHVNGST